MEQYNSTQNKETEKEVNGNGTKIAPSYGIPIKAMLRKIIGFICYGPGVFGFLWLIGRIFKR
jgi:hypothetical protein